MSGPSRSRQVIDSITQAAKQAEERQPNPVSPAPPPRKVDRSWERLHRATPIRLGESDFKWLQEFAAHHAIAVDAAGREIIRAMHEAIEQGWVTFTVEQEVEQYEDTLGRQRTRVHTELEADWQISQS